MLPSTAILLLQKENELLKRELEFYRSSQPIQEYPFNDNALELNCPILPDVKIPLYFNCKFELDKLMKLNFKAFIKGIGEFAYYCDASQLTVHQEAKIFDDIIGKLVDVFVEYHRKKLNTNA